MWSFAFLSNKKYIIFLTRENEANFESQNFEGPYANLNIEKKNSNFFFLVLILPKYSESAQKCFNFRNIYYISKL